MPQHKRIHRSRPESEFARIPNAVLQDERLSYQARGILADILSRPDTWVTTAAIIWARARRQRNKPGEGRGGIYAAFAELEAAGYLRRVKTRGPRGRFATEVHFCDQPGLLDKIFPQAAPVISPLETGPPDTGRPVSPVTDTPVTGRPAAGAPVTGTPADSLSQTAADIRQQVPDVTEKEIDEIVRHVKQDPKVSRPGPYLRSAVANGDALTLVSEARARLSQNGKTERPPWCGKCVESTRLEGDPPRRCPDCHPLVDRAQP